MYVPVNPLKRAICVNKCAVGNVCSATMLCTVFVSAGLSPVTTRPAGWLS